jgi:protease-4
MEKKTLLIGAVALVGMLVVIGVISLVVLAYYPYECIAVIKIDGPIATTSSSGGLFGGGTIGSDDLGKLMKEADSRSDVKAVVFEVNSPGGSVVASREIYESIKEIKKPKVAYFREVAASGGYYVSMGTDYIVSNPDAITGSIGVISTSQELSGLFEKLGINETVITSGPHKDMGSEARPLTEEERGIIKGIIQEMYQEFRGIVVEGRGNRLDMSQFDTMTDGRVVTGRQAYRAGLVDQLGNKQDAINKAANMAGMNGEPKVCEINVKSSFMDQLFSGIGQGIGKVLAPTGMGSGWSFSYK